MSLEIGWEMFWGYSAELEVAAATANWNCERSQYTGSDEGPAGGTCCPVVLLQD